jgi:hypothetical protein
VGVARNTVEEYEKVAYEINRFQVVYLIGLLIISVYNNKKAVYVYFEVDVNLLVN